MFAKIRFLGLTAFSIFMAGCSKDQDTLNRICALEAKFAADSKKTQISSLETRISNLEAQLAEQKKLVSDFGFKEFTKALDQFNINDLKRELDRFKIDPVFPAILDCSQKYFSISRNQFGSFPIIIKDTKPVLDGHIVTMQIGNLSSAVFNLENLAVVYGVRDPIYPNRDPEMSEEEYRKIVNSISLKIAENKKNRRNKTFNIIAKLLAGSWNTVEITIAPSKAEDLGNIEVNVIVKNLELKNF